MNKYLTIRSVVPLKMDNTNNELKRIDERLSKLKDYEV